MALVPSLDLSLITFELSLKITELIEPTRGEATVDAVRFGRFAIGVNFVGTC
jgi:hypothetical protein